MDSVGRVESCSRRFRSPNGTETALWDFLERLAMKVLMMRLEEGLVSGDEGIDAENEPRFDWAWALGKRTVYENWS